MRNLKSSNTWGSMDEVESDPSHGVLLKNFEKLGKFSSKTKYSHTLGDQETTVKWEPKKQDKGSPMKVTEGMLNVAWKNTCKGYGGNPLDVEVSNRDVKMFQDFGKMSLGGGKYTLNPFVSWTMPVKSNWNWWSQSSRFGHVAQFNCGGWDVVSTEDVNWESNTDKSGPGSMRFQSHQNWKRDQNELTVTSGFKTAPEEGIQVSSKFGYMRRDKNWSLWMRHAWMGLNPMGTGSVASMGATWNANDKTTVAACAEFQVDPEDGEMGDGNVHVGATFKPCSKMSVTGKVSATRDDEDNTYRVGLHLNNKWCKPFETNFVIQADTNNLKRPTWGLNVSNNF